MTAHRQLNSAQFTDSSSNPAGWSINKLSSKAHVHEFAAIRSTAHFGLMFCVEQVGADSTLGLGTLQLSLARY